ncbi:hypothetical protein, partial [Blautia obeum]
SYFTCANVWWKLLFHSTKEKQDAITKQQASSSAIERKARCNHQAASILKCHRKKNKMQSPGGKHPQLP